MVDRTTCLLQNCFGAVGVGVLPDHIAGGRAVYAGAAVLGNGNAPETIGCEFVSDGDGLGVRSDHLYGARR